MTDNIVLFNRFSATDEYKKHLSNVGGVKQNNTEKIDLIFKYNNELFRGLVNYASDENAFNSLLKIIISGLKGKELYYTHFAKTIEHGVGVLKDVPNNKEMIDTLKARIDDYISTYLDESYFTRQVVETMVHSDSSRSAGSTENKRYEELLETMGCSFYDASTNDERLYTNMPVNTFMYGDKSSSKNGTKRLLNNSKDFIKICNNKSVDLILKLSENHILAMEEKTMNNCGGHQDRVWDEIVDVINRDEILIENGKIAVSWGVLISGNAQVKLFTSKAKSLSNPTKLVNARQRIYEGLSKHKRNYFVNRELLKEVLVQ